MCVEFIWTEIGHLNRKKFGRDAFTIVELLTCIAIVSVLMALVLPAVQAARAAARRIECQNKIRQLALGLHSHVDSFKALPPGTGTANGFLYQGWQARILPFIEQNARWTEVKIAFSRSPYPFNPVFHANLAQPNFAYACPEDSRTFETALAPRNGKLVGLTSYLGCLGTHDRLRDGLLFGGSAIKFASITDGLSNTLLIGERPPSATNEYGWWYAGTGLGDGTLDHCLGVADIVSSAYADCDRNANRFRPGHVDDECDASHFWSLHSGGGNFALADGSVRFFSYGEHEVFVKLSSRAGGEVVSF